MINLFRGNERKTIQMSALFTSVLLLATMLVTSSTIQPADAALYQSLKNVSNNDSLSVSGVVAAYGSNVFVAWADDATSVTNIYVSKSTNGGSSFGAATQVSNTQNGAYNPTIFAVGSYVYLAWSQQTAEDARQIMFARSSDSGLTYSNPKVVSEVSSSSNDGFPSITALGSSVYLSWVNSTTGFGPVNFASSSVYFAKSPDYGVNFSSPLSLSGPADAAVSAFAPQVAVSGKSVYVTWPGEDANGMGVKLAVSTNSGSSFGAYRHLATTNFVASPSSLAIAASGKSVYISYENNTSSAGPGSCAAAFSIAGGVNVQAAIKGDDCSSFITDYLVMEGGAGPLTVAMIKSTDGGKTFGQATNLQTTMLGASGSPRLTLSTNNAGKNIFLVYTEAHRDENGSPVIDVYITTSKNSGSTFSAPQNLSNDGDSYNPGIAAYGSNVFIIWQSDEINPSLPDVVFTRST